VLLRPAAHLGDVALAYEDLEPLELAARLNGMFAFAIWDARREPAVLLLR
jgi:asparagine synthetase B (glutamine-hydrolysing)